ncbi:MAG: ABC transporter permease subunit [Micromonosporaceae bacterium]|nr:ABC transporter permease subunit [Micromonosporaceae bacterium]
MGDNRTATATRPARPGAPARRSGAAGRLGRSPFSLVTALIAVGVLALVLFPLGRMVVRAFEGFGHQRWESLVGAPWFSGMLRDTVVVVGASAVIALLVAALLAWINERTDAGIGMLGDVLPLVPLFLPTVAMAVGWVLLANPDVGLLNGALGVVLEPLGISYEFNIFSYPGLILVYVLNLVPFAYLPIAAGFRSMDPSLEEAARVSGARASRVLRTVSLPAIGPAVLAGLLLVMVVGFALYSVPVIIGTRPDIDILAVRIIRSIRQTYPPAYDDAVLLSTMLLALLLVLWVAQRRLVGSGQFARIGSRSTGSSRIELGPWRWPMRSLLWLYVTLAAVLPILALGIVSFQTYWQPDLLASEWTFAHYERILFGYPLGQRSVENSLFLGLVGGGITVLVAALVIVYAHRRRNLLGKVADAVAKLPAAVPNTVLALAFVLALAGPPFQLGATLLILALAYFVVYIPYASIASEASVASVDNSMEEASGVSGAGEGRTFARILVPLMAPGLFAAWALVFVRILGDLPVAVLLGTGRTPVIGFVLLDVWDQGIFNRVAALALVMTAITVPVVMVMMWLGRPRWRRAKRARAYRARA